MGANFIKNQNLAVFDLDRTIILNTSAEVQLIHFLRSKRLLPWTNFVHSLWGFLRQLPHGMEQVILRKSVYLMGLKEKDVLSVLPEFFEKLIKPRLSPKMGAYIKRFRTEGHETVLLSGSLDFIVDFLAPRLGIQSCIGSKMEVKNGVYTGGIVGTHPYGHGKVKALNDYLKGRRIDFSRSFAFGDSWADVPLMSLFGYPLAVNPGLLLRQHARRKKWTIIDDSLQNRDKINTVKKAE